jgi:hypothetical protein
VTIEDVQSALVWTLTTQSITTVYLQVFQQLFDSSYSDIGMPSGVVAWWLVQFGLILRFDTANFSVSWYSVVGLRFMTADQFVYYGFDDYGWIRKLSCCSVISRPGVVESLDVI